MAPPLPVHRSLETFRAPNAELDLNISGEIEDFNSHGAAKKNMGMSENVGYIPNEIAI